ncbi:hypothetical protein OUZ56_030470 [Daphnia magna]|uniref:Uncharacterized protein n=1 Tax=Daphnia magna TaxID=35525 RepID=A0ABQ9ZRE1_9CRUS|nr:hypothetical protein OUZ56_030470 [Daphnia magna]
MHAKQTIAKDIYGLELVVYNPWLSRIPGLVLYTFCTCTERSGTKSVVNGFAVDKQGKDLEFYRTRQE